MKAGGRGASKPVFFVAGALFNCDGLGGADACNICCRSFQAGIGALFSPDDDASVAAVFSALSDICCLLGV